MPETEQIDPLHRKAYIRGWERKPVPDDDEISYWFCEFAKDAATWASSIEAENAESVLNIGVNIPSIQGGIHSLRNFTIEQLEDKFVIFCSGPFIYTERGTAIQEP